MNQLLREVEKYVSSLLGNKLSYNFIYHNLSHTQRVVQYAQELIENENIDENNAENLLIAAWFHDTGFIKSTDNHEAQSVKIASAFLKTQQVIPEKIEAVSKIILATKMNQLPESLAEKMICDADCAHFGSKQFFEISELLRFEWEQVCDKVLNEKEWVQENISFLTKHHQFYTSYALTNWQKGKDKNLVTLFKTLKKLEKEDRKTLVKDEALAFKKKKAKLPERGIDTLFRVTLRNHISLSDIADTKANILLSVNAIIVSLVLSNLIPKLDNPSNQYLIYPTVIFTLFTITAMILSVLATRPNVTSGQFTKEDVKNKKVNLLFFGNFHKMKLEDFEWAFNELMKDKDYLYNSMTKDLYFLGIVVNKKYKILRITYNVFMTGIIISVIAFYIAFQYYGIRP